MKLDTDLKKIYTDEDEGITALHRTYYGTLEKGKIVLLPEEALYLMDIRNAKCTDDKTGKEYGFNDLAKFFYSNKLMAKYFTLKDWRDRGLIIRPIWEAEKYGGEHKKSYPPGEFEPEKIGAKGLFFPEDLVTIIDDTEVGKLLYEKYWFGQLGTYKAEHRGKIHKMDVYETLFLMKHSGLKTNYSLAEIKKFAKKKHTLFPSMYDVYEDWRMRGYVLKTGFKFGTHFRIYFPGAKPVLSTGEWIHSKHVLHVFPKKETRIISEWARVIRVAHSVRKTFILAIPGTKKEDKKIDLDFLLYHRVKNGIATPKEDKPKYLLLSLSEEEYIGGAELAYALNECRERGLRLLLGIADRESGVTYYRVERISLPKSKYEYYEVEWVQP